jgi:hypothetical protein
MLNPTRHAVPLIAVAAVAVAGITGCSSKNKTAADPGPTATTSLSASTSPASPSSSSSPHKLPKLSLSASAVANTLDPCRLVTQREASTLTGASYGPGKEEGTKLRGQCVYGAETPNVLMVFVVQAASEADAQSGWNQLLDQAKQSAGQAAGMLNLTDDSTIGDRAEWVELDLAQVGIAGRGLAFQKGTVGVYIIDEVRGGPAPTREAMTAEAQTVLGRLP